jgi:hypothetical protein
MPIHGYPGNVITANPTTPSVSSASGVWTTEQQLVNQAAGRWPMAQTQISRSLRFNSADSAYLNRTPASASNRETWTWSGWVKRTIVNTTGQNLFSTDNGSSTTIGQLFFNDDWLEFNCYASSAYQWRLITTQVWRDLSAWYHIVAVLDTTQATSSNRVKLYVNGVQITAFSTATYPSQNFDGAYNLNQPHYIGAAITSSGYLNGYLTEVNFIDGLALDPSYFGFNDSNTGVWTPRQYTGAYGTNGFYVNFSDNSNTTAATLGKDYSGNGNNWTPNNFSVTAGAGNDSLVDSPTSYGTDTGAGGSVRGNYCTLYPLWKGANITMSNGNLDATMSAASDASFMSTITMTSGKWYWEVLLNSVSTDYPYIGVATPDFNYQAVGGSCIRSSATGFFKASNANKWNLSSSSYGSSFANGDIMMIAYDADNAKIYFGKNGTWDASSDPATSANPAFTGVNAPVTPAGFVYNCSWTMNFGQRAFAYTAPSGFKALCTQNLPTPTIGATSTTQANDYFNAVLYTGNGSSQTITGVGFQPDFTWIKSRSGADNHNLFNAVVGLPNRLFSNLGNAENTTAGTVTAFNSDGFSVGSISDVNANGVTFVGWNWNAGGSTVTNTSGTISAQVRANTTAGFSIISYTGNKTSGATIGHGLGVAPAMVIIKERANSSDWIIYHQSLGATQAIYFTTAAANTNSIWFNNTAPSSTVITLGNSDGTNRANTMIAYAFAPVAGYSAFGSYTGNGSTDGPFVYLGFRPAFVLWKRSDGAEAWWINDIDRLGYNGANRALFPNLSNAENTANNIDILSNGFKIRGSGGEVNASGGTYIYACFAENPFKYSLAR